MEKLKHQIYNLIRDDDENNLASSIFDGIIIMLIVINVTLVILDTFQGIPSNILQIFHIIEMVSIIIFTLEYLLRLWTSTYIYSDKKPIAARIRYAFTFMAMIDLLAILPFYLPFIIPIDLRVLRTIRLLRLLRILKVNRYTKALGNIVDVIKDKSAQLISSLFVVLLLMVITSILMYNFENEAQPEVFENAFSGMWWAVATLTTVGYGDIYPITVGGKILSAIIAVLGIGLVAVPTGIISAGFIEQLSPQAENPHHLLPNIENEDNHHLKPSKQYCPFCGSKLE